MRKGLCLPWFFFILCVAGCVSVSEKKEIQPVVEAPEFVQSSGIEQLFGKRQLPDTVSRPMKGTTDHSYLTEESIGQEFTINGTLYKAETVFFLIENEKSKSRVTFYLEIPDELSDSVSVLVNQRVVVVGTLLSVQSTWTKTLKISVISQPLPLP